MSLVISHGDANLTNEILLRLIDGHPIKLLRKWIKFFSKNKKEKVFAFPRATINNVGSYYKFDDRKRLLKSIQNSSVSNLSHKIILSSKQ